MPYRVLVTGASSGLGQSLVQLLSQQGHSIVAVGRSTSKLQQTMQSIEQGNRQNVHLMTNDLSQASQYQNLIEQCETELGGHLDILVNNAGFSVTGQIEDISGSAMMDAMHVNYFAPVSLIKQVLPGMKARKSGTIVNVTSGVALRAVPYRYPYCTAKAALNCFTDGLRIEVANFGIHVFLFSPGPMKSSFHKAVQHCGKTKITDPPFHGRDAKLVARICLQAIRKRKTNVSLGFKASIAKHLSYFAPHLTDRLLTRMYRIESLVESLK